MEDYYYKCFYSINYYGYDDNDGVDDYYSNDTMYLLHCNFLQVRYLQQHDELARQIAQNGHNFALSYLRYGDNIFF